MRKILSIALAILFATVTCSASVGIRGTSIPSGQNSGGNMTVALPTGTTTGDVTVVTTIVDTLAAVVTAPAGWTLLKSCGNLTAFYRAYQAGDTANPVFADSGTHYFASGAVSYTGADGTIPIDGGNCSFVLLSGLTNNHEVTYDDKAFAPEFVTSYQNGLQVAAFANSSGQSPTFSTPSGFTSRLNQTYGPAISIFDKTYTTGGWMSAVQSTLNAAITASYFKTGMSYAIKASGSAAASAASGISLVGVIGNGYTSDGALVTASSFLVGGQQNLQSGDLIVGLCGWCTTNTILPSTAFSRVLSTHNNIVFAKTYNANDPLSLTVLFPDASVSTVDDINFVVLRAIGSTLYPALCNTSAAGTNVTNPSAGVVAPSIVPCSTTDALVLWYEEPNGNTDTLTTPGSTTPFLLQTNAPNNLVTYVNQPSNPTGTFTATGTATSVTQATGFSLDFTLSASKTGTQPASGASVIY